MIRQRKKEKGGGKEGGKREFLAEELELEAQSICPISYKAGQGCRVGER